MIEIILSLKLPIKEFQKWWQIILHRIFMQFDLIQYLM